MQVKDISEDIDVNGYIVDICDCRIGQMNCHKRIDTCLKKNKKGENQIEKIKVLNSENLVRIFVKNGGFKTEICHCCNCCCVPINIQNTFPEKIIYGSGKLPIIHFDFCTNCGVCKSNCPFGAINGDLNIDKNKCLGCGLCWNNCKENAIEMVVINKNSVKNPNRLFSLVFSIIFLSYITILFICYSKKCPLET